MRPDLAVGPSPYPTGEPMSTWRKRTRGSTVQRGYGRDHRRMREAVKLVVSGGKAKCWRCNRAITPLEPWDLGHRPDRNGWAGPEHRICSRRSGLAEQRRRQTWR
jgi:hypothetical protein